MIYLHTASDPNPRCVDYCGNKHDVGDKYTAPDGCNTCTCTKKGPSCTYIACP